MKSLSIDATALCGHQQWVSASIPLVGALPPNLETLNLRIVLRLDDAGTISIAEAPTRFDNTLWLPHVLELIRDADKKLPLLKNIGILVHGRDWPDAEDSHLFKELVEECSSTELKLTIKDEPFGTKVPYFQEQTKNRWLGRDRWYQRKPMRYRN